MLHLRRHKMNESLFGVVLAVFLNTHVDVMVLRLLFGLGFFIAVDLYAYQAFKTAIKSPWTPWVFWSTTGLYVLFMTYVIMVQRNGVRYDLVQYVAGATITLLVPKLITLAPLVIEDVYRLARWVASAFSSKPTALPSRRTFISQVALGLAAIPFAGIIYGMWKGKYRYRVLSHTLEYEDLPEAFDGFTIAQISDIHSGSFDNPEKVRYGVDMVNQLNADIVVFTGDMVNNLAEEAEPYIPIFGSLKGKHGQYSILGNHDYGDYHNFPSATAKVDNLNRLKEIHGEMGMDLLLNESRTFEREGQQLFLAGVENWGLPPFPQYGDLGKSLEGVPNEGFTVLLSHDPSHYDAEVKKHNNKVHLTLAGHTHGMQFGIEIPGWIKWSPVKFRYPKWAGLYKDDSNQHLHVNRGFGYLAFPGRVGMWPEITHITLKKKTA